MDLLKKFKYIGLCASVAVIAFGVSGAWASGAEDDSTISIDVTEPSASAAATDTEFGQWAVVNVSGTTATITLETDDTVTLAGNGVFPDTRFIEIDDSTAAALTFAVTGGAFLEEMSFQIGEATDNTPGSGFSGVPVTLAEATLPLANGTFTVDNWNCEIAATPAGTTTPEAFVSFVPATGLGSFTLGSAIVTPTITSGVADIVCGMDITTVDDGMVYGDGSYEGLARIVIDYL